MSLNIILHTLPNNLNDGTSNYTFYILPNDIELISHYIQINTPIKGMTNLSDYGYDINDIINKTLFKTHNDEWIKVRLSGKNLYTWEAGYPTRINKMMNDILQSTKPFNFSIDKRIFGPYYENLYYDMDYRLRIDNLLKSTKRKSTIKTILTKQLN